LISRSIAKILKSPIKSKIHLCINGINKKGAVASYDVIDINIKTNQGNIIISAPVVDTLPTDIYIPGLVQTTNLLRQHHIKLSNPFPPSDYVNDLGILIGADYINKFLKSFKTFKGINLIETPFGSALYGDLPFTSKEKDAQITLVSSFKIGINFIDETDPYKLLTSQELHSKEEILNKSSYGESSLISSTENYTYSSNFNHSIEGFSTNQQSLENILKPSIENNFISSISVEEDHKYFQTSGGPR